MKTLNTARAGDEVFTNSGACVGFVVINTEAEISIELDGFPQMLRLDKRRQDCTRRTFIVPVPSMKEMYGSILFLENPKGERLG